MNEHLETPVFEDTEIIEVRETNALPSILKAEIDIQISTAKAYPRDIAKFKKKAVSMACLDRETAETCFYSLPRGGKTITGPSVRLAEIVLSAYGNLRAAANVIANDRKTVTARAMCHDLESNTCIAIEVKRKITDKHGRTYTEDMQVVTGNAACAIALRNAIFKVIPMAFTKDIYDNVRRVAAGNLTDLNTRRKNAIEHFKHMGVTEDRIFAVIEVSDIEGIDLEKLLVLIGLSNALRDGDTSIEEAFPPILKKTETQDKADEAMKKTVEEIKEKKNGNGHSKTKQWRH